MYISKVSLVNYRNFRNSTFVFNKGINTIIGENGSGKTNLFRAIRLVLDNELLKFAYKLEECDFNRSLGDYRGHWIIISIEFSELSPDEDIQALFVHSLSDGTDEILDKATYNLFFRPKGDIRLKLSELTAGDRDGLQAILNEITIADYESYFTGKSTANFSDEEIYKELAGDFENVKFNFHLDASKFGVKIPHQMSISNDICFTFIKALRDVVSDFNNNRTNPLLALLRNKSKEIDEADYQPISDQVEQLNTLIENLSDVQQIRENIKDTIKEAVGETYSPSSLSIRSSLPSEADKLLQSLKLFIGEPNENYEGSIHELSLGGANLIFLTLKLLEFKYQKTDESFANFLLIEEPEAHIHTHIQKTLFDRIEYDDTQIIYSTHSTFISEACNIESMNILSKNKDYAEVFQPSVGLDKLSISKLQRYLDAVRSNLLFAKGVILVEGDAEEILVPRLVKKVFGITLDELGISLINIGSTGFANVAQLFNDQRLRRKCSIVTDLDKSICDTTLLESDTEAEKKYKSKVYRSEKSGAERKVLLDSLTDKNQWLQPFYANYTFEVDLLLAGNSVEYKKIIDEVYSDNSTRELASEQLASENVAISGRRALTMANHVKKGWFALLLGEYITFQTEIPEYIIDAILHAKCEINRETIVSILKHRISEYAKIDPTPVFEDLKSDLKAFSSHQIDHAYLISSIPQVIKDDQIINFLKKL